MERRLEPQGELSVRTGAVVGIVVAAFVVFGIVAVAQMTTWDSDSDTYTITISVDSMEVACDDGYVYNVCQTTAYGDRYYNPSTGEFDLPSPSKYAVLYTEFTVGSVTEFSDCTALKKVQTSAVPVSSGDLSLNEVEFKVRDDGSEVSLTIFLRLMGSDSNPDNGTPVDIFDDSPDVNGMTIKVELKDDTSTLEVHGSEDAVLRGLLKLTVTVTSN